MTCNNNYKNTGEQSCKVQLDLIEKILFWVAQAIGFLTFLYEDRDFFRQIFDLHSQNKVPVEKESKSLMY